MPNWTDDQAKAIYEPSGNGNILVSAAAGSGKTAVLVERIINLITSDNPLSIDRMLIVTFTEAAAAEMKERIITRINKSYREALTSGDTKKIKHLKEQIHLTSAADINTIDAFCLRVVKNNFHILGTDPNFSIMDNSEREILIDDTLSDLFMSLYATENEDDKNKFLHLISIYASNRADEGLKQIIKKLYGFIQSFPDPDAWLTDKGDMYGDDMSQSRWLTEVFLSSHIEHILSYHETFWDELISNMLETVRAHYPNIDVSIPLKAVSECNAYWGKMWQSIIRCRDVIKILKDVKDYDGAYKLYDTYIRSKAKLGNAIKSYPGDIEATEPEWQKYYSQYDAMRDDLREQAKFLPSSGKDEFNEYIHSAELTQTVREIVWLTKEFSDLYEVKKDKRNEKSFSDIEHLTYKLFCENENIRSEYMSKYDEILIDEYQDTNSLQDSIFTLISRDNKNLFMVGDLKQSIYRFRGGDPTIFKTKSKYYAKNNGGKRISLSQNFRSRREVIDSINDVFSLTMSDNVGDVDYNDDEALKRDIERECYIDNEQNAGTNYKSEFHFIGTPKLNTAVSAESIEAAVTADKIEELMNSKFQVHKGNGEYRDIEYKDIVILMRSVKGNGDALHDELKKRGIPSFIQKEDYFERREIKLMLTLISLINNNLQDIPLVSVMRSPIGDFSDNELSKIRLENRSSSFFNAVRFYKTDADELNTEEARLRNKCRDFLEKLDRWRGYVKTKSIASLIWTLYEETGLYDFMGVLEGGEEAQANLKLLYERAKRYEDSGFKGIFNFIRYIERMEARNEDLSGARLINENHNVIRIMTIHKSKGLEFPVVFLMRTTKNMISPKPNDESRIQLHKDFGIGIDYINYEDLYKKELMFTDFIKTQNKSELLSEELRLLYVAMTRAKEKLIVTSVGKYADCDTFFEEIQNIKHQASYSVPLHLAATKAKTYSDWLAPAVLLSEKSWRVETHFIETLMDKPKKQATEQVVSKDFGIMRDEVQKILDFHYIRPENTSIPTKTSVTAIKEMADAEHIRESDNEERKPIYMSQKPDFMRSEKLGTEIGTAHHQLMAFTDIEKIKELNESDYDEFISSEFKRIAADGQITMSIADDNTLADMICKNAAAFWKSEIGKAVLSAQKVYRESAFEISIPAYEYDNSLVGEHRNEPIILQGIIDLYFIDKNGNVILADYKTDKCQTDEEQRAVAEKYRKQLELYARAMEKILNLPVKDKYLYLFSPQNVVKLD